MNIASIDIGSNTVLLLIAEINEGKLAPIINKYESPRLGKGLQKGGNILPDRIEHLIQILTEYKLIKIVNHLEDGGDAPAAKWHEPSDVQNYCELFSRTWSETETESNTNVYGKESMAQKAANRHFRSVSATWSDSAI